jgi:hypothetical protein
MINPSPANGRSRFARISLRQILIIVFAVAVAMATFGANDPLWSATLTNINMAFMVAAAVAAIYAPARPRAFCFGFLIGNGIVMLAEFIPDLGRPLLQHMLAWQLWSPEAARALPGASWERCYIGALLTGWLYGCAAGGLAVWLRTAAINRRLSPPVEP